MTLYIKYMVSLRCREIVHAQFDKIGVQYHSTHPGQVKIKSSINAKQRILLKTNLLEEGFELMSDKKARLIVKIKKAISDIVNKPEELKNIKNSEYLQGKLNYDYTYMANLFSQITGTTIEQYIIAQRIERVKELLIYDELNLTEISYELNYSSVAHLSYQFKKITGLTPTFFKTIKRKK